MTSHPTSAQNSGLSNNSISNSSFPPPPGHVVSSSSTSTSSTAASYAYSQQPPASDHHSNHLHHQPSTTSSTTRFNSFSLPPYRSTHPATDSPNPTATHPAFAHNPFAAASNPNLADSDSRLQPGSTSSTYQQQQQAPSQLLSSSNITSSSSTPSGSAAKTAGGGGGSGSAGSGVQNLSLGQIHLLIATINDRNYETKRKEIQRITESSMDVNGRVLRKLIADNYSHILSPAGSRGHDFKILTDTVKSIAASPQTAKERFADAITSDSEPSKVFRDFDLSAFLNSVGLDFLQRAVLAAGFKDHRYSDLQKKGVDILRKSFPGMLDILANPSKHPEMTADGISHFLRQLLEEPVPHFIDNSEVLKLSYAVRSRYKHTSLPAEISEVTDPIEHMRKQESLVSTLEQYGPECTRSLERSRDMLKRKSGVQITEQEVADVLTLMATWPHPAEWNSINFVEAMVLEGNLAQNFDWAVVIDHLDRPNLVIEGPPALLLIIEAVQRGSRNPGFPIQQLWAGRWKHPYTQWCFLRAYLKADDLDVTKLTGLRKVLSSEDFATANNALKAMVATFETQKLNSYDAVDALLYLSLDNDLPDDICNAARVELDRAAKLTPELLLCGALMTPTPWTNSVNNVIGTLFDLFFEGHTSYQMIFWRLWHFDKSLVANRFVEYYVQNPLQITRILDISQDLRCLSDLLEIRNAHFVLDVAALAARREYLNLEKWLHEMLSKYGGEFWGECYKFLKLKAEAEYQHSRENSKQTMVSLRVGPVYTFLAVLDELRPPVSHEVQEQVTTTQRVCIQAYPRLINMGCGFDSVILQNNAEGNSFPNHIDKEMQQNYRKLYAQETGITEMVTYLEELRTSKTSHDQELFACMIHGLFDEYDCFPNYPIHALATTSVLFGSIIRFKLVDHIPLRVALAMVYQAVRDNTTSSSMYKFGLQALVQFRDRLKEWKSYCNLLSNVPGLQGTDIWNAVQEVVQGDADRHTEPSINGSVSPEDEHPDLPNGEALSQSPQTLPPFRSLQADTANRDPFAYENPSEEVQDKVLFIVNNVAQSNLDSKIKDLHEWLDKPHYQWFADYLVVKRAKLEPNYHTLYLELLDKFGEKGLVSEVLRETYVNVIKLLNAETTLNNSTERTHLKNLGSWLGGLTIAKDKPIKFKNISFKDLIIEGWETDRLIVVLPFTCKVLEQATKSTAFRPPNPWLMAVIRLLKELYENVALKLNLKFEIEVLCKNLDLDIKLVESATDIHDRQERQAIRDENEDEASALLQLENLQLQQGQPDYVSISNQIPHTFADEIAINSGVIRDATVKRIIIAAIERTAHEIIGPVVERSVTIATIATSQLIQKDFATEPDETKMRSAAVGMAQKLAGHLALVTCKEPMRLSMVNNIRNLLSQNGYGDAAISEQTITMIVNDNLDYVCRTVETAAERGAVPGVDESLQAAYTIRKRHRESRSVAPFISPDVARAALGLPEVFRLKQGGLTPQQLAVYEEFARPTAANNVESSRGQMLDGLPAEYLPGSLQGSAGIIDALPEQRQVEHATSASPPQSLNDPKNYQDKLTVAINEMRKLAKECGDVRELTALRPDHAIFQYIEGIVHHIGTVPNPAKFKENLCTGLASVICNALYSEVSGELEVESLVFLLKRLCDLSPNTAKEVIMWLQRDREDERYFNLPTTVVLLRAGMLSATHLDNMLARMINAQKPFALEFLARLIQETQAGDPPLLYRADFAASLNAVATVLRHDSTNAVASALWNSLRTAEEDEDEIEEEEEVDDENKHDQMEYIFIEWVQLFQHIATTEKNYSAFIIQLHQGKVIAELSSSAEFFRSCIEFCIEEFENSTRSGSSIATNCYIPTDALAKMVMLLVRYQVEDGPPDQQLDKVEYLESLLSLVVSIFNHQNEVKGDSVCQKVFFRFFSSLLFEFRLVESYLEESRDRIFKAFAECFLTLQPAFFPMFTFHWVTLISHRYFMPKLLSTESGQTVFTQLLSTLFTYLGMMFNQEHDAAGVTKILHQGTLRILLVIHHDFPGYLSDFYFPLVDAVPHECTQIRNLILSALPLTISEYPDPFASGMQVNSLPEIKVAPKVCGDTLAGLRKKELNNVLDTIFGRDQVPSNEDVGSVVDRIQTETNSDVTVDVKAINSLVLHTGAEAIESLGAGEFDPESVHVALIVRLVMNLQTYGRYVLLTAIANNLRFPNSHTYFFSNLLVHLFDCANGRECEEAIREQIARVLMERLVVHRPHPWGLIITLLELIRHRQEEFWNLSSIRKSPEISRLLHTVLQQIDTSPIRQ